jgi:hypothetical protein
MGKYTMRPDRNVKGYRLLGEEVGSDARSQLTGDEWQIEHASGVVQHLIVIKQYSCWRWSLSGKDARTHQVIAETDPFETESAAWRALQATLQAKGYDV